MGDATAVAAAVESATRASTAPDYWSKRMNCKIRHTLPDNNFFVINLLDKGNVKYAFCLFPEFSGWIILVPWLVENLTKLE